MHDKMYLLYLPSFVPLEKLNSNDHHHLAKPGETSLNETACKLHIITHPARFHYVIKESFTRLQHFFLSLLALPVLYGAGYLRI